MSNTNQIVAAIIQEDLVNAKNLINEALIQRLGNALEEKLATFAPSVIGEASKPDFLDLDKDGNKKEPMKKAAKEAKDVNEGWTDQIPDGQTLTKYLSQYMTTGKMPKELYNYYNANPSLGQAGLATASVSKGSPVSTSQTSAGSGVSPSTASGVVGQYGNQMAINAGYEPELNQIIENFEQDLIELVEEIQADTGEILSEEEIAELAEEYLNQLLSDEE